MKTKRTKKYIPKITLVPKLIPRVTAANGIASVLSRVSKVSYETALHEVDGYINEMKRIAA